MINPKAEEIKEAKVRGETGELVTVRVGDNVKLLSANSREKYDLDSNQTYSSQKVSDFLKGIYGVGRLSIFRITKWPCGRQMLHLRCKDPGSGCCSSNFMKA